MAFIQIIEMKTSKIDELTALEEQWKKATEGKRTLRRSIVTRDRNNPNRHLILAFFDSYESAMENSNRPETGQFAEQMQKLCDGPPKFVNLDVIDTWQV